MMENNHLLLYKLLCKDGDCFIFGSCKLALRDALYPDCLQLRRHFGVKAFLSLKPQHFPEHLRNIVPEGCEPVSAQMCVPTLSRGCCGSQARRSRDRISVVYLFVPCCDGGIRKVKAACHFENWIKFHV
ncbi:hypothetical protein GN956_G19390 [Arapaima gigas]